MVTINYNRLNSKHLLYHVKIYTLKNNIIKSTKLVDHGTKFSINKNLVHLLSEDQNLVKLKNEVLQSFLKQEGKKKSWPF